MPTDRRATPCAWRVDPVGSVNQRRVLTRRSQDVARLYAPTPDAQVIVIT